MSKLFTIFVFLLLSGCGTDKTIQTISGNTMGTNYLIKIADVKVTKTMIDKRLNDISKTFSSWDKTSKLSYLNQYPVNQWLKVSDELLFVLTQAQTAYVDTNGWLDVGIGRLIDVWGFGTVKTKKKPSKEQISNTLNNASIKYLLLNDTKVKKIKDIHINLSAIAKGYAVDEIAKLLIKQGSRRFMVEIGGEIIVKGQWSIGIEMNNNQQPIALDLNNKAIATSGNYRNYLFWEGKRYAHILNPHTGMPASTDLFSVSVVDDTTLLADAYATAMMAMGSAKAKLLAKRLNLKALLVLDKTHKIIKIGL